MRSVIRPVVVGLAAVGMSVAGVASAEACGHHVHIHKNSWSKRFDHNFNDNFSRNFSHNTGGTVVFGDLN